MKIERVKILEIDDSLDFLPPTRTIEIKTDKGNAITPNRCVTSYEFNRKAELPTEVTIDNPISVYHKKLTGKEVGNLISTNEEYGKQLTAIEKVDRLTEYSTLHTSTFQLYETSTVGESPMEIFTNGENQMLLCWSKAFGSGAARSISRPASCPRSIAFPNRD